MDWYRKMNTGRKFPSFEGIENSEQKTARYRINSEKTVPVTGPPGTGKSTVISHSCFDLIKEYSPVLVVSPTNAMVNSILAKIDYLAKQANLQLPRGFIIRYGNLSELNYSHPYLKEKYAIDDLVQQRCCSSSSAYV